METNHTRTIVVSPIGDISPWMADIVAKEAGGFFGFPSRVESVLNTIDFAFNEERNQYHSTEILKVLETKIPDDCVKIIAITKEDLFIPILTHVYGEAQLGGSACVVSIARLIEGSEADIGNLGCRRIVKEAIHELGHTFDLRHCEDEICIMYYCRRLDYVDKKSNQFCRYCSIFLSDNIKDLYG